MATMHDEARLRALISELSEDPAWFVALADGIAERVFEEFDDAYADPGARARFHASVESSLRLLVYMIRDRVPAEDARLTPATLERIRVDATREMPLEHILRGLQLGHGLFLQWLISAAHDAFPDAGDVATAFLRAVEWTFEYVEILSALLVRAYTAERDRWLAGAVARRVETVRGLLAGEQADAEQASAWLGYDLARRHTAVVVWSDDPGVGAAQLDHAARALTEGAGHRHPLAVPLPRGLVGLWIGTLAGEPDPQLPATLDVDELPGVRAAAGTPSAGLSGFTRSHLEAVDARRVAELVGAAPGSVTRYDAVALTALNTVDVARACTFARDELGALADHDERNARLRATLQAYLEEAQSPRRAAARLGVHENTIVNRLRAIRETLPHPPEHRAAELLVALRLAALLPRPGLPPE